MDLQQLPDLLLPWFAENKRDLPWRKDRLPYHVWLSEIMLQQTRVEAVKGYYARFLAALPDIASLADCDDELLNKLWEGLGYYSRVRNLKKAAGQIMLRFHGEFPREYGDIRSLSGIGDYTAGAIASICFDAPTPAVDGNVLRVITRVTACTDSITKPETKKAVSALLAPLYPAGRCGSFTQALMELGATVCLPNGAPECERCPLGSICKSRENGLWKTIPVKDAKKPRRIEEKTVWILRCGDRYAIHRRENKGLLAGLWEFPNLLEIRTLEDAISQAEQWGCRPSIPESERSMSHIFTHIEWHMRGYYLQCREMPDIFTWATAKELEELYSLPTAFRQFFTSL